MKKFLVSKNIDDRASFIESIKGKKIAIYNKHFDFEEYFDYSFDMALLMKDDYFLESILKIDSTTTLVLIDVLVKNGVYVHPYGKIFRFTEVSKETLIIDTFMFRYNEKNIVRPFLFINTSVFGTSMLNFHNGENNVVENYYKSIKDYVSCNVKPINIEIIQYHPTQDEINDYETIKSNLISNIENTKPKIVNSLINFIDNLTTKKQANNIIPKSNELIIYSNKQKEKFNLYKKLSSEKIDTVYFFSSGIFGADEMQLKQTMYSLIRHNKLIRLINE